MSSGRSPDNWGAKQVKGSANRWQRRVVAPDGAGVEKSSGSNTRPLDRSEVARSRHRLRQGCEGYTGITLARAAWRAE